MFKKLIKKFLHWWEYGTAYTSGDIKYYIVGKGYIVVDIESLLNSKEFKRQCAAASRLSKGKKIEYCGHGGIDL